MDEDWNVKVVSGAAAAVYRNDRDGKLDVVWKPQ
jgi:hypothetical protein